MASSWRNALAHEKNNKLLAASACFLILAIAIYFSFFDILIPGLPDGSYRLAIGDLFLVRAVFYSGICLARVNGAFQRKEGFPEGDIHIFTAYIPLFPDLCNLPFLRAVLLHSLRGWRPMVRAACGNTLVCSNCQHRRVADKEILRAGSKNKLRYFTISCCRDSGCSFVI